MKNGSQIYTFVASFKSYMFEKKKRINATGLYNNGY